jgi:type VII secretion-associated serine protease mycosin
MRQRGRALASVSAMLAGCWLAVTIAVMLPASAAYAACTTSDNSPTVDATPVPWPVQRYAPDRLTNFADGRGVTVAVIDSGVDASHPSLRSHVAAGLDLLDGGPGQTDCVGHGTAVASIIAGQPLPGIGFRGLAPAATILPYRVTEQTVVEGATSGRAGTAAGLATAIRKAVDGRAKVINLSIVLNRNDPDVQAATKYAVDNDVVVVAAVGNAHDDGNPRPFPASYDGVLGVGAIGADGRRVHSSQVGDYVDLVAPGSQVVAARAGRGYSSWEGTSFAAPFVAATAALVRQYWKGLSARDVVARLIATADPAPGSPRSNEYGYGVVNPYRAVTERLASGSPGRAAPLPARSRDVAGEAAAAAAARTRVWAFDLAGAGVGLAILVMLAATVLPRGRSRRWQPDPPS